MNNEQLKKGNELLEKIGRISAQIEILTNHNGIFSINLSNCAKGSTSGTHNFQAKYFDFDVMKTLAMKRLENELLEAKEEFKNL